MSAADAVRALADSGTPGPWTSTWQAYDLPMLRSVTEDVWVGELRVAADAAKIAAAVNALPKVADLIEAVATHRCRQRINACVICDFPWPCPTATARDALAEALGVSS